MPELDKEYLGTGAVRLKNSHNKRQACDYKTSSASSTAQFLKE